MEKNRYLNQLLDVIRVLRGSEKDVAKKHLKAYETNHTVNNRKMFQLYKYIIIKQIEDYDKLKKRISPQSTDDSFNKLIRRTMDRIQESLIIDVNIRRKGSYSDIFRMKFFIRKLLMQGQILMGRGLTERPRIIFDTSIRYAKRYELYDELIEALFFKQTLALNTEGGKAFEKLNDSIEFYENCRQLLGKSKKIQRQYDASIDHKSNIGKVSKTIRRQVNKILDYHKLTNSANILTFYYLLTIDILKSDGDVMNVVSNTRKLITLLESSVAVYSHARVAFLHSELVSAEFTLLRFNESIIELKKALSYLKGESVRYILLKIREVNIYLLMENYVTADNKIKNLATLESVKDHPIYNSRITFQKAVYYFCIGQFKKALELFSEKSEIEKDKEGWNVWLRIMRLLCSIEMLKLNLIDYDIESFRKYLQRINKQYEVRLRDKLVLRVLLELDRQNYDFELTAERKANELEKLKSTDKRYAWNPDSPEMILFHDWFEAKRTKKDYKPNFEVYRKAWN